MLAIPVIKPRYSGFPWWAPNSGNLKHCSPEPMGSKTVTATCDLFMCCCSCTATQPEIVTDSNIKHACNKNGPLKIYHKVQSCWAMYKHKETWKTLSQ